jgi:hypothetical protein
MQPRSSRSSKPALQRAGQSDSERNRASAEPQKTSDHDPRVPRVQRGKLADEVPPEGVPVLQNLSNNPRDGEGDWSRHSKPTEHKAATDSLHASHAMTQLLTVHRLGSLSNGSGAGSYAFRLASS